MMRRLPETFAAHELDLLLGAALHFVGDLTGVESDDVLDAMNDVASKVARLRLIGKKVKFQQGERILEGTLQGYMDWEGLILAEVVCNGYVYRVGEKTGLLGEV